MQTEDFTTSRSIEKFRKLAEQPLLYRERLFTDYISLLSGIRDREKIARGITDNIRNSLDLDQVFSSTVNDIGKLFQVDRCMMTIFEESSSMFQLKNEYRINKKISPTFENHGSTNIEDIWHDRIIINKQPIIADISSFLSLTKDQKEYLILHNIKSLVIIPILYQEELLGTIILHQIEQARKWNSHYIELLKDISNQIAIAIKHAQLYFNLKKYADKEQFLRRLISTISSSLDINEILEIACDEIATLFNVQRATIVEFTNPESYKDIITKKEYRKNIELKSIEEIDTTRQVIDYIAKYIFDFDENSILAINDIQKSNTPDFFKNCYKELGVKSILCVPIKKDNIKWGVIVLSEYDYTRSWTNDEVSLLRTISDQLYITISQTKTYQEAQKQAERERTLRKIITTIRSSLDIDDVINIICQEILLLFNVERVGIIDIPYESNLREWKVKSEYTTINDIKLTPESESSKKLGEFLSKILFHKKCSLAIDNVFEFDFPNEIKEYYKNYDVKSILIIPIKKTDKIWGTICLAQHSYYRKWLQDEIELLETISDQIFIAIRQAEMYSTIKQQLNKESLMRSDNSILINRNLAKNIGLNSAISYSALANMYHYYNDETKLTHCDFFICDLDELMSNTYLNHHEQEKAIQKLMESGLIQCKNSSDNKLCIRITNFKKQVLSTNTEFSNFNQAVHQDKIEKTFYDIDELYIIYSEYYPKDSIRSVKYFFEKSKQVIKGKETRISRLYFAVICRTLHDFMCMYSLKYDYMRKIINEWFSNSTTKPHQSVISFALTPRILLNRLQKTLSYRLQEAKILATDFNTKLDFYSNHHFDSPNDKNDNDNDSL